MAQIDYYFSTLSPYTYFAGARLEEIAEKHGASIAYKPMDIGKVFAATGGKGLADRPKARLDYRMQELARWRTKLGMPLTLEPAFFRAFLRGLGLPEDMPQNDRETWPEMAAQFAERIAQRTRDEWAQVFDGTDACVTPVLNWEEAERHPHNVARGTFVERAGVVQPAPAPRMSGTPSSIRVESEATVEEMLARWTR